MRELFLYMPLDVLLGALTGATGVVITGDTVSRGHHLLIRGGFNQRSVTTGRHLLSRGGLDQRSVTYCTKLFLEYKCLIFTNVSKFTVSISLSMFT